MPEAIDDEGGVFDNATLVQTYAVIRWDPTDNRQPLRHTVAEGCGGVSSRFDQATERGRVRQERVPSLCFDTDWKRDEQNY